ncbi:MAG: enoyl-CoA hydratase/isomerase family protein [Bacteroidales bacterium]|nr:enoyl-CoA hydratase/isomerase family protein [Bacteroidales bacterium]
MKSFDNIEFELVNSVGTVWMNRPDKHNAMNAEMILEIIECFEALNDDENVRVVVLRGRGKSFCAGADLNYMKGIAGFGFEENYQDSLKLARCFNVIYTCQKPTIAVVQGAAIGGANGLLAACDYVFCTDDTKFAFAEVKLGIAPATISPYVVKRIGEFAARDLMISGRRFTGKEAEWQRLVNKSLPAEEIEEQVTSTIKQLLTSGPEAMKACKQLIFDLYNKLTFDESIDYSARLIASLRASTEGQEGMASFLEKRPPNWTQTI